VKRKKPLARGTGGLKRTRMRPAKRSLARASKSKGDLGLADRIVLDQLRLAWHRHAVRNGCEACRWFGEPCRGQVEGHHVVYQQHVKAHVNSLRLEAREAEIMMRALLWDKRNAMGLCDRAHKWGQHKRGRPIPRQLLPASALEFAAELGLLHKVERLYPPGGVAERIPVV
jgi:hypothetical protein